MAGAFDNVGGALGGLFGGPEKKKSEREKKKGRALTTARVPDDDMSTARPRRSVLRMHGSTEEVVLCSKSEKQSTTGAPRLTTHVVQHVVAGSPRSCGLARLIGSS